MHDEWWNSYFKSSKYETVCISAESLLVGTCRHREYEFPISLPKYLLHQNNNFPRFNDEIFISDLYLPACCELWIHNEHWALSVHTLVKVNTTPSAAGSCSFSGQATIVGYLVPCSAATENRAGRYWSLTSPAHVFQYSKPQHPGLESVQSVLTMCCSDSPVSEVQSQRAKKKSLDYTKTDYKQSLLSGSITVHVFWLYGCVNNIYKFNKNTPLFLQVIGTVDGVCDSLFLFHNGLWAEKVIITGSLLGCKGMNVCLTVWEIAQW